MQSGEMTQQLRAAVPTEDFSLVPNTTTVFYYSLRDCDALSGLCGYYTLMHILIHMHIIKTTI